MSRAEQFSLRIILIGCIVFCLDLLSLQMQSMLPVLAGMVVLIGYMVYAGWKA